MGTPQAESRLAAGEGLRGHIRLLGGLMSRRSIMASALLVLSSVSCAAEQGPSFGARSDHVEDTGWDGFYDPVSWLRDYWTSTHDACEPPEPFEYSFNEYEVSDRCKDALAADLKVDLVSFSRGAGTQGTLFNLLADAYYLLGRDQGSVDDLALLDDTLDLYHVRDPFIGQVELVAAELGHSEVRQAVYNLVMSTILITKSGSSSGSSAEFHFDTRTLRWNGGGTGWAGGALTLVHESAHGWQNRRHTRCPEGHTVDGTDYSGEWVCDEDWGGAWGFHAASARLMLKGASVEEPDHVENIQDILERATAFILED